MSGKTIMKLVQSVALLCLALTPVAAVAQNQFRQIALVNGAIITEFELEQRARFLTLLGSPTGTRADVLDELIKERLRIQATTQAGIELSDEALQTGLTEFAARAELSAEEFVERLEADGVAGETFRDFVTTSLLWRDYVRARFGSTVRIGNEDVDRAVQSIGDNTSIDVLVSEIIIPTPPDSEGEVLALAQEIMSVQSEAEFSEFARQFSATASRDNGGRLEWVPITDLPPQLRPILLALAPGDVTAPLPIPDAIALFQLRSIRERAAPAARYSSIEYATYFIAGGRSPEALARARQVEAQIDRCDDLYGIAKGQPESVLQRYTLPPAEIPRDIAIELAKLDRNEVSTALTRANGSNLMFLMLCGRTPLLADAENAEIDREAVAVQLRNARLSALADTALEELQSDADIVIFD
ncbi:peptidylprolyl isomerase [Tateyamaria pelophila]|uniref:peptidylprolyl isomerase n=1 Tax=Tateyamaria pelophila TaxID=328415 RepID=UPI001CBE9ADD|nr:peptidylprolyl isomerase [Tateyamaria pelophila]